MCRRWPLIVTYIAYILLAFGCFLSLVNFYLSFLRYPVHRLRGRAPDDYRWMSGYPLVGSLVVFVCLPFVFHIPWLFWLGVICAALDTGGLHWFLVGFGVMAVRGDS